MAEGTGERTRSGHEIPNGGCFGEAERRLNVGGREPVDPMLAETLSRESYVRSQNDSRVRQAVATWAGCMSRRGYDYKSPDSANNDPTFNTKTATAREIAVATADVRCKQSANLINIWATVETAYQKRYLDQRFEQLSVLRQSLATQAKNADQVLAAG